MPCATKSQPKGLSHRDHSGRSGPAWPHHFWSVHQLKVVIRAAEEVAEKVVGKNVLQVHNCDLVHDHHQCTQLTDGVSVELFLELLMMMPVSVSHDVQNGISYDFNFV